MKHGEHCPDCAQNKSQVLKMRYELAWTRVLVAELRLYLSQKAGFNPDQPRDWHGRWTETGAEARVWPAQAETPDRYKVNLAEEEARGGHAIRRHVGRSDIDLITTLSAMRIDTPMVSVIRKAESTFLSLEGANDFVNRVLGSHPALVDSVARGEVGYAEITERFGYVTGKQAFRPNPDDKPYIRKTYSVEVRIEHDKRSKRGYSVITAFPYNDDERERKSVVQAPRLLGMFSRVFIDIAEEKEHPIEFAYQRAMGSVAAYGAREEMIAFFENVLRSELSDEELTQIWDDAGGAFYFVQSNGVRLFATEALEAIRAAQQE